MNNADTTSTKISIGYFGPVAGHYSLARVNRGLILELLKTKNFTDNFDLRIIPDMSHSDDLQKLKNNLKQYPEIVSKLWDPQLFLSSNGSSPDTKLDILIYNNFPRDPMSGFEFKRLAGTMKIAYLAWEEDLFPENFVEQYNNHLDLVVAASEHTRFVLRKSGVVKPIVVIPNALDQSFFVDNLKSLHTQRLQAAKISNDYVYSKSILHYRSRSKLLAKLELQDDHKFIFMHNSSGHTRKGLDVLISAYLSEFTAQDNTVLLIKSFPNQDNELDEILSRPDVDKLMSADNAPQLEIIRRGDLTDDQLQQLYLSANCYVAPSRAEGFNLPVLEALYLGLPVIATGWSGHMDFLDEYNSWLLDYKLAPATSTLNNPGAYWAEPSKESLKKQMRHVFSEKLPNKKLWRGATIAAGYSWETSAAKFTQVFMQIGEIVNSDPVSLAVLSTYNSICGIAEYTSYLYDNIRHNFKNFYMLANKDATTLSTDPEFVYRTWSEHSSDFDETIELCSQLYDQSKLDVLHIQYNLWKFPLEALVELICQLDNLGIQVILTAHNVRTDGFAIEVARRGLERCREIQLLSVQDCNYLKSEGFHNVKHTPHGNTSFPPLLSAHVRLQLGLVADGFIAATHGFAVPEKGIDKFQEAVRLLSVEELKKITGLAVTAVNPNQISSQGVADQIQKKLHEYPMLESRFLFVDDFLTRMEVLSALSAANIAVFAYENATETASGAIRLAIAAGLPLIVSNSAQLKDIQKGALHLNSNSPNEISAAIKRLSRDDDQLWQMKREVVKLQKNTDWDWLALKYWARAVAHKN